jgi:hypothetical protein
MVAFTGDASVVLEPVRQPSLADASETQASIAAYLGSAERMLAVTDVAWKLCAGLMVLIVVAWAAGVLPSAIRLL